MAITVRAQHISKTLNSTTALSDVSTIFEAGSVHGIVGPNGAGKTTLLRLIKGLLKPTGGTFQFEYHGKTCTSAQAVSRMGYFPQEPSLYPDLSVWEHLEFFCDLYNLDKTDFHKRAEELLQATGMAPFKDRPAGKLSGGMYKKLGLMCVLLNRPALLLLDEPTIGVDPVSRQELWDIVYNVAGAEMTVILSTSYMDEAERCTKVHLLQDGRLLAEGQPQQVMKDLHVNNFIDIFLKHE